MKEPKKGESFRKGYQQGYEEAKKEIMEMVKIMKITAPIQDDDPYFKKFTPLGAYILAFNEIINKIKE